MIVVDTGSTDRTPEIVRRFGARQYHFPWCDDFSAARNESLKRARGEWIFWIDSDETIDARNGRKLRELAQGPHDPSVFGYVMQQVHPRFGPGRTASLSSGLARIGQDAAGAGAVTGAPPRPKCRLPKSLCLAPSRRPLLRHFRRDRPGCVPPSKVAEFEQRVLYEYGLAQVGFSETSPLLSSLYRLFSGHPLS